MANPKTAREILASAISDAVKLSGMSVADVARQAGITRQHLYRIMAGEENMTTDRIEQIFQVCGADFADWLIKSGGRDKQLHDRLQALIDQGGHKALTVRTVINTLIDHSGI